MDEELKSELHTLRAEVNLLRQDVNRNAGYLARHEIERLISEISLDPKRLETFGFKVYSQNDEDGIIEEIFSRLNISKGTFIEIGVESGLECNTLFLLHKGFRGGWIEGNSNQEMPIKNSFGSLLKTQKLILRSEYVYKENLNEMIRGICKELIIDPFDLDFLSIDVDGMDIYLFEALNYSPKVICIEYNAKFPPDCKKIPVYDRNLQWTGKDYMGSSLDAINEVAQKKGYTLVGTNIAGVNAFFIKSNLVLNKFSAVELKKLYNPPRYYLWWSHFSNQVGHLPTFGPYLDLEN